MSETTEELWYMDEGLPGTGSRPEWLQSKYATVAEQAKAYPEAQKQIGTLLNAIPKAPETYDVDSFEAAKAHAERLTPFLTYAKENNLSQEAVQKALSVVESVHRYGVVDEEAELAKLGREGADVKQKVTNWIANNFSEDTKQAFERLPKTAESLKILNEARNQQADMRSRSGIPMSTEAPKAASYQQLFDEMRTNVVRYESEPSYMADLQSRMAEAIAREGITQPAKPEGIHFKKLPMKPVKF